MSDVREEYTRENYPSFGKKYNGEKAIISLTSWRARINTVSKTLFSLLKQCPGFHIVLVLSEEEFPKMMDELPDNLKLFVDNELIEVLWVYKNYRSFKKWIFTSQKYPDVPIITADDGCVYIRNYAEELYQKWLVNKNKIISYNRFVKSGIAFGGSGSGICFTLECYKLFEKVLPIVVLESQHDDFYYGLMTKNINWIFLNTRPNENNFINLDKTGISKTLQPDRYIPKILSILH